MLKKNLSLQKENSELKCWNPPNIFDANEQPHRKDETNFENLPIFERELSSQTTHINGNDGTTFEALCLPLLHKYIFLPVVPRSEF